MPMSPRLLRPRASGAFSPRSIANLGLWLDAADTSTFTFNSGNVSEWRDKSGGNRHATQSTAANQPLMRSFYSGISVPSGWDLAGRFMEIPTGLSLSRNVAGFSAFFVAQTDFSANSQTLFAATTSAATSRINIAVNNSGLGGTGYNAGGRRLDADSAQFAVGGTVTTAKRVMGYVFDYANTDVFIRLDGVATASNLSYQTAGSTSNTDSTVVRVLGFGNNWFGDLAEVIIVQRAVTATETTAIERYLGKKWGITVA